MQARQYELRVKVNGRPIKEFDHKGKVYVEGRDGSEYSLMIRNNSGSRILAIPTVDGINALTGEPANPSDGGYVVDAYSSLDLQGFRQDDHGGGRFKFCSPEDGYCEVAGAAGNNGVIGVIIWTEKVRYRPKIRRSLFDNPYKGSEPMFGHSLRDSGARGMKGDIGSSLEVECSSVSEPDAGSFDTATEWGSKFHDSVTEVTFDRGHHEATLELFYASKTGLKKLGVPMVKHKKVEKKQFPQSHFGGYAKPPVGWRG